VSDKNEEDRGSVKFTYLGNDEVLIETKFPQNTPENDSINEMSSLLYYVHSGSLMEQNASSVLEICGAGEDYETGVRVIQRWRQVIESEAPETVNKTFPFIKPSDVFKKT
jgi:hypothetical protein